MFSGMFQYGLNTNERHTVPAELSNRIARGIEPVRLRVVEVANQFFHLVGGAVAIDPRRRVSAVLVKIALDGPQALAECAAVDPLGRRRRDTPDTVDVHGTVDARSAG